MKDYAEGRGYLDDGRFVSHVRKTVVPYWLLALLALGVACLPIWGCAQPDKMQTSVCFIKPLGQTEDGYGVIWMGCKSPEAFAESQK